MADYTLPDLPYDYGALEPTSPGRSWSCTTPSTTPPTSKAPTPPWSNWPRHGTRGAGHGDHAGEEPGVQPGWTRQPLGVLAQYVPRRRRQARRRARRGDRRALRVLRRLPHTLHRQLTRGAGIGLVILGWESLGQRLVLEQVYDHQSNMTPGMMPLLLLDMWEHAFYLQYRNVKPDYVEAWWNVVNWADAARFAHARSVVLP